MLSQETKFLGFGFKRIEEDLETRWVPVVHNKSRKKLKDKIRMGIANCSMNDIDKWIRRRIRQIYLKMWKKNSTKYEELKKLKTNNENIVTTHNHSAQLNEALGKSLVCELCDNKGNHQGLGLVKHQGSL